LSNYIIKGLGTFKGSIRLHMSEYMDILLCYIEFRITLNYLTICVGKLYELVILFVPM